MEPTWSNHIEELLQEDRSDHLYYEDTIQSLEMQITSNLTRSLEDPMLRRPNDVIIDGQRKLQHGLHQEEEKETYYKVENACTKKPKRSSLRS